MKAVATLSLSFLGWAALGQAADLPKFRHVTIDDQVKIGYGTAIADMNGDKKPDIILCDARNIAWYENPSWKKHIIIELYDSIVSCTSIRCSFNTCSIRGLTSTGCHFITTSI